VRYSRQAAQRFTPDQHALSPPTQGVLCDARFVIPYPHRVVRVTRAEVSRYARPTSGSPGHCCLLRGFEKQMWGRFGRVEKVFSNYFCPPDFASDFRMLRDVDTSGLR